MKNFVFVEFSNESSDAIYKKWLIDDTHCRWPPKALVQFLTKKKANWKETWEICECKILCQASKFT